MTYFGWLMERIEKHPEISEEAGGVFAKVWTMEV